MYSALKIMPPSYSINAVFFSDPSKHFTYSHWDYVDTATINFDGDGSDVTLPATLAAGEVHSLRKTFSMPFGTINAIEYFAGELTSKLFVFP